MFHLCVACVSGGDENLDLSVEWGLAYIFLILYPRPLPFPHFESIVLHSLSLSPFQPFSLSEILVLLCLGAPKFTAGPKIP